LCLLGFLAGASCSNPIYNTPGAFDPYDVSAITVTPPSKRLYYWGEPLDLTRSSANIYYRGSDIEPKLDQEIKSQHVSGFDSRKEGIQTIAVTIEGQSDYFDIALVAFKPNDDDKITMSLSSPNLEKTISNELGCSWKLYIFESASRNVVKLNGNGQGGKSGSTGDISFNAPSTAGDYIIAVSFKKDGYTYNRFYKLSVSQ
jgi:hypothetical protein